MSQVKRLPPEVAERIAAGEVVDRPVSIVKELIENSLDAGSTLIEVELEEGGRQLIRVTDNGSGMTPEDAQLAVERHATSKLRQWEDLDSLYTFGFRGEALPSVAAVSRFELLTTARGESVGTKVRMEGPLSKKAEAAAGPVGTRIDVRDLFWNTPARRKFLKSPTAETVQVTDLVTKFAILNPEVGFRLTVNGKEKLFVPEQSTLAQRLAKYWKLDQDDLMEVSQTVGEIEVAGIIAKPTHHRRNRTAQLIAVNGRIIRSQTLSQAFVEGFDPLVPRGRQPYCFVNLTLDPAAVDVNIHPTKAEVRFADSRAPFRAIYRALRNRLDEEKVETLKENQWESALAGEAPKADKEDLFASSIPPVLVGGRGYSTHTNRGPARPEAKPSTDRVMELYRPPDRVPDKAALTPPQNEHVPQQSTLPKGEEHTQGELYPNKTEPPQITYLTRLYGAYLVARVDDQLWVIDQHAAHERISYERLHRFQITGPDSQGLVVPFPLTLNPQDRDYLESNKERFQEVGFDFCETEEDIFLSAVPPGLPGGRAEGFFDELLAEMSEQVPSETNTPVAHYREKLRAMMACKSSIRARERISPEEALRLIEDLISAEHSPYCPHGRPTRIRLDERTLERLFHRS
jgi:DNA mismatch repair protein MutL